MYKVLIIDDEAPARIAISRLGHWADYHITELYQETNGAAALKTMREIKPQIVFVDMQMPVMNGMEFLEKASHEFRDTCFIVISGYDYFDYAKAALKCGAIDYLLKPIARVARIRQDIDQNYPQPLKVSSYAKKYFFTQEYLTRLFRQHYEMTIQEYLLMVRMTRAKELLENPSIKIQEVAARVGYSDNNYFSKAFRNFFGITPTDCRNKCFVSRNTK